MSEIPSLQPHAVPNNSMWTLPVTITITSLFVMMMVAPALVPLCLFGAVVIIAVRTQKLHLFRTVSVETRHLMSLVRRACFWIRLVGIGTGCSLYVVSRLVYKIVHELWSVQQFPTFAHIRQITRQILTQPETQEEFGQAFCRWCYSGGVAFVKFAQLVSGRDKEFAPAFLRPLKKLQSHVPAHMKWRVVQPLLPTHKSLLSISQEAFACGCGAQVHAGVQRMDMGNSSLSMSSSSSLSASASASSAETTSKRTWFNQSPAECFLTRRVALKVKSIYLEQTICDSFAALIPFCRLLIRVGILYCREDKLISMLNDVRESLTQQLDLHSESMNQQFLRRRFRREDHRTGTADNGTERVYPIYIPRVIPELTNDHVLGMEYVDGESLEIGTQKLSEDQRQRVAETMVHLFYNATFFDYYLDPDNHAGNFLLSIGDPELDEVRLIKLDFGLAYRLKPKDAQMLARFCLPFLEQNTDDLAAWFFDRIEFHSTPDGKTSEQRKNLPELHERLMSHLRIVVSSTLCCSNPSWLRCVTLITALFDQHACNMSSEVDHFLMALGHLETTAQLFINTNIAQWMVENSGQFRNENLRDFAYGEAIELEDDDDEEAEDEKEQDIRNA